jgi:hypothetical protein
VTDAVQVGNETVRVVVAVIDTVLVVVCDVTASLSRSGTER